MPGPAPQLGLAPRDDVRSNPSSLHQITITSSWLVADTLHNEGAFRSGWGFLLGLGPTDFSRQSRPFAAPPPHLEVRSLHVPSERADITHRGRAEAVAHRAPQRVEPGGTVEIDRDELREPRFAEQ